MATTKMTVKFTPNDKGNPPGKLADAELHFADGPLDGLKLIGFGVWETRTDPRRNVTFPARQYSVNGERRSFALLRPISDTAGQERIRDLEKTLTRDWVRRFGAVGIDAQAAWDASRRLAATG